MTEASSCGAVSFSPRPISLQTTGPSTGSGTTKHQILPRLWKDQGTLKPLQLVAPPGAGAAWPSSQLSFIPTGVKESTA